MLQLLVDRSRRPRRLPRGQKLRPQSPPLRRCGPQRRWAPLVAGALAFAFAWPLALLPLVSVAPAVLFGIGAGLGTASGARIVRRGDQRTTDSRPDAK